MPYGAYSYPGAATTDDPNAPGKPKAKQPIGPASAQPATPPMQGLSDAHIQQFKKEGWMGRTGASPPPQPSPTLAATQQTIAKTGWGSATVPLLGGTQTFGYPAQRPDASGSIGTPVRTNPGRVPAGSLAAPAAPPASAYPSAAQHNAVLGVIMGDKARAASRPATTGGALDPSPTPGAAYSAPAATQLPPDRFAAPSQPQASTGFSATMPPDRRMAQLKQNEQFILGQLRAMPPRTLLVGKPEQQQVEATRSMYLADLNTVRGQMDPLATMLRGAPVPEVAQTNEQVERGRWNLQQQADQIQVGRGEGLTPQPSLMPKFDRYDQVAAQINADKRSKAAQEKFTAASAQAMADEGPRRLADEAAAKGAQYDRVLTNLRKDKEASGLRADIAANDAAAAGSSPKLAQLQTENKITEAEAQGKMQKLAAETAARKAEAEQTVATASVDQQRALLNPVVNKALDDLLPLYTDLAGSRNLPTAENAAKAGAYEAQVARFEQAISSLPPAERDLWKSEAVRTLASHQGGNWLNRAMKSLIYWYSGDGSPNDRVNKASDRLFKLIGVPTP